MALAQIEPQLGKKQASGSGLEAGHGYKTGSEHGGADERRSRTNLAWWSRVYTESESKMSKIGLITVELNQNGKSVRVVGGAELRTSQFPQ